MGEGGRCPEHKPQYQRERRGTTKQRGYGADWERFRKAFLADPDHALCADCRMEPSTDVHHVKKIVDFPELRLVESNCLGLCGKCHDARSARGE